MEPTQVMERFAALLADGNVRDALALYEPDAAFVVEPGTVVVGHAEIGAALEGLAALRPALQGEIEQVVYAGDLALVANRWTLEGTSPDGEAVRLGGRSADVLRCVGSGEWRIAIDDPWGGGQ
jgi:ketosteroid isomerase-like protein